MRLYIFKCTRLPKTRDFLMGLIVVLSCLWSYYYWRYRMHFVKPKLFSLDENNNNETNVDDCNEARNVSARLHLIIQFPVLNTSGSSQDANHSVKRQEEYIYCLQQNLLSPHVQEVNVLLERDQDRHFVQALNLVNNCKLVFHSLGKRMTFKDAFGYASNHLLLKNTMILQADCYIGQGFEHLNESILSKKTMYFLTRHETPENVRNELCSQAVEFCGPNSAYIGSHDGYLFRLLVPVPLELLDKVDYRSNLAGIENVIIYYFRKYGGYTIKNPCRILHIVHYHCIKSEESHHNRFYRGNQKIDQYLHVTVQEKGWDVVLATFSDL